MQQLRIVNLDTAEERVTLMDAIQSLGDDHHLNIPIGNYIVATTNIMNGNHNEVVRLRVPTFYALKDYKKPRSPGRQQEPGRKSTFTRHHPRLDFALVETDVQGPLLYPRYTKQARGCRVPAFGFSIYPGKPGGKKEGRGFRTAVNLGSPSESFQYDHRTTCDVFTQAL